MVSLFLMCVLYIMWCVISLVICIVIILVLLGMWICILVCLLLLFVFGRLVDLNWFGWCCMVIIFLFIGVCCMWVFNIDRKMLICGNGVLFMLSLVGGVVELIV